MNDDVRTVASAADLDRLDFAKGGGSVIVVAQDAATREVVMVASADRDALERTLATGEMHYRSRTRGLWHKGATSGNVQRLATMYADCDGDTVLALVTPAGPACHTGATTCFGSGIDSTSESDVLDELDRTIAERARDRANDGTSYTRRLLADRNLLLKKLGEECAELIVACADSDRDRATDEAADLYYHMVVALRTLDLGVADLRRVLSERRRRK